MSKKILFVCVENAGRSQMAEAFFKKYYSNEFAPISAGTNPSSQINPTVVKVMKEVGVDLENNTPKPISDEMIYHATKTINLGCMDQESCPALFMKDIINWNIPDPKGKPIEEVRKIRDEIDSKIKELVAKLRTDS